MRESCRNEWCQSKVERKGLECGPCQRSGERTARLMARVDEKAAARVIVLGGTNSLPSGGVK